MGCPSLPSISAAQLHTPVDKQMNAHCCKLLPFKCQACRAMQLCLPSRACMVVCRVCTQTEGKSHYPKS